MLLGAGVEGVETRMIGRDDEELAAFKRDVAESAVKKRVGQPLIITGDAGVGKSRLIHEFSNWVRALPYDVPVFKGRTYQQISQLPYGLNQRYVGNFF